MKRIAIIGAGASGLIAACYAAMPGREVTVFEKQKKIGSKILVSGNGRCNISNRHVGSNHYHGGNKQFITSVLESFTLDDTLSFFSTIGLPIIEEKEGKLFPAPLQSSTVVRFFEHELYRRGVDLLLQRRIDKILPVREKFRLSTAGQDEYLFDAVILSCGSCAFPPAGASHCGYDLARSLGHRVKEPFPAIVPLNVPLKALHRLQGIKWQCAAMVRRGDCIIFKSSGELLFTAYGLSGPLALDISRTVNQWSSSELGTDIIIDFFPEYSATTLAQLLNSIMIDESRTIGFSLLGILKHNMPEVICLIAGIDSRKAVSECTPDNRLQLVSILKALVLQSGQPRGFQEAVVAAGGVDVEHIDPKTMASRLVRGLYITGELLDIDGVSGGFNLQFAWSTGAIAGKSQ